MLCFTDLDPISSPLSSLQISKPQIFLISAKLNIEIGCSASARQQLSYFRRPDLSALQKWGFSSLLLKNNTLHQVQLWLLQATVLSTTAVNLPAILGRGRTGLFSLKRSSMAPKVGFLGPFCAQISLGKFGVGESKPCCQPLPHAMQLFRAKIQGQRTPSPI